MDPRDGALGDAHRLETHVDVVVGDAERLGDALQHSNTLHVPRYVYRLMHIHVRTYVREWLNVCVCKHKTPHDTTTSTNTTWVPVWVSSII